jgi:para-aminobenzoate synthetase / 4-amino-4-deoxychorismate lyase
MMRPMRPPGEDLQVRFDDLTRTTPMSLRFLEPIGVVEASAPDEIAGALDAVEAACAEGRWAAGFLAYEAAPGLDPALRVHDRDHVDPFAELPLVWFAVFERAERTTDDLAASSDADADESRGTAGWEPSITRSHYDRTIETIREHIRAGDTYQVNYTLRLRAMLEEDPLGLYRRLCRAQRAAYNAYLRAGRYHVLSASPELFFRIDGDRITTRPMKGTAARGRWVAEDDTAARDLRASAKDRAENAMIVDLLRNDLGRIARPGSVRVPALFQTERYETVWQLTSTVTARLHAGVSPTAALRTLFPCGSVTGAPKVRTMEIIRDLEDSPRGVYTGAIGFFAPPDAPGPRACFNVAIRTVVVDDTTGTAEYGVGGGITYDSTARGEYREVVSKARVLSERRPEFSLLETLAHDPATGFRRLDAHLDRLRSSARYFGFTYDEGTVRDALDKAVVETDGMARVRCVLQRDGSAAAEAAALPTGPATPARVAIDDPTVDPRDPFLFHKTTLRRRYVDAAARHPDADDVLLVNLEGEVTESTIANVAVELEGRWWTPPLTAGLLPGVERGRALADGRIEERPLSVADVRRAASIALLSSVRGWRPASLA